MIDPRVKGTVNVRASGRLSRSELISIMETLLIVNGATLVQEGQVFKILPAKEAASGALPVYRKGSIPEGTFAQVVFLDQTPAKEMLNVLKPLISQTGSVSEGAGNLSDPHRSPRRVVTPLYRRTVPWAKDGGPG